MGESSLPPVQIPGYEYLGPLAQGAMGSVHLLRQQVLDRLTAVKVFRAQAQGVDIKSFQREAQILARLDSQSGIVSIYEAGQIASGEPYIAMQYCSGPSLDKLLAEGRISVEAALSYGEAICRAVASAHEKGVIHGDIKPANILTEGDQPYLSDFGSARLAEVVGQVEGVSVPWAAPEVLLDGEPTSVASDVYSLAATVWTLLAGRPRLVRPSADNSMVALVQRIRDEQLDAMPRIGVPDRVLRALDRGMDRDPSSRLTPVQLQEALIAGASELRAAPSPLAPSDSASRPDAGIYRTWGRTMLRSVAPVALNLAALNVDTLAPVPGPPAQSRRLAAQMPRAGTVAVLTAVPAELVAVRSHLRHVTLEKSSFGATYAVGQFIAPDRRWRVACACIGPGNYSTALVAQQTMLWLQPDLMAFIGVAGGLKDVTKGDVVVATKVVGYEGGKDANEFLPRPTVFQTDNRLIQHFGMISTDGRWRSRIPKKFRGEAPRVHLKPIVAGEKVLANRRSALVRDIRRNHSDAVAVEMEGLGLYSAAAYASSTPALAVRGISDLLSGKGARNDEDWQPKAAANAAALFFAGLAGLSAADFRRVGVLPIGPEGEMTPSLGTTLI